MMWRIAAMFVVLGSGAAWAKTIGGDVLALQPGEGSVTGGAMGAWLAVDHGTAYVGGELAFETFSVDRGDIGISYHALLGTEHRLGEHTVVLADGGLGITQELDVRLGILGGESTTDTIGVAPSGAVRVQLVLELAQTERTTFGLALSTEGRAGMHFADDARDFVTAGVGVGAGLFLAR